MNVAGSENGVERLKRAYIHVPPAKILPSWRRVVRALVGSVLSPTYWLLAYRYDVPGLNFRLHCARLGFRLLYDRKAPVSYSEIYRLLFWPMNSTRYFEFAFVYEALSNLSFSSYLDISSPRLLPIVLTLQRNNIHSDLINPDLVDLQSTAKMVEALELEGRCKLHGCLIDAASFEHSSFDVVTSISVVEHIPQDTEAIRQMWSVLKPRGRLLLTLPCAAQASEQYIDKDDYGLLEPDTDGHFFFQRLYDQNLLEERIFSITGKPHRQVIYGERSPGALRDNLDRKRSDPTYPYWREPYMMGKDFCHFKELQDLPGEGVIALEFQKSE